MQNNQAGAGQRPIPFLPRARDRAKQFSPLNSRWLVCTAQFQKRLHQCTFWRLFHQRTYPAVLLQNDTLPGYIFHHFASLTVERPRTTFSATATCRCVSCLANIGVRTCGHASVHPCRLCRLNGPHDSGASEKVRTTTACTETTQLTPVVRELQQQRAHLY